MSNYYFCVITYFIQATMPRLEIVATNKNEKKTTQE